MPNRIHYVAALLLCGFVVGCMPNIPVTPEGRLEHAKEQLKTSRDPLVRIFALPDAAKLSFEFGYIEDARKYAEELKALGEHLAKEFPVRIDGTAVHDSNMVLGRIAVLEGRIDDAKAYLLKAGATTGSPVLDTFGPNMSLAKDLLEEGEREVVLEYFELCRKFWDMERGNLDAWSRQVKAGEIPDFGANLKY